MSLLSRIVFGLLLADSGVVSNSVPESGGEERLLLQADNTVIVNRDTYSNVKTSAGIRSPPTRSIPRNVWDGRRSSSPPATPNRAV